MAAPRQHSTSLLHVLRSPATAARHQLAGGGVALLPAHPRPLRPPPLPPWRPLLVAVAEATVRELSQGRHSAAAALAVVVAAAVVVVWPRLGQSEPSPHPARG